MIELFPSQNAGRVKDSPLLGWVNETSIHTVSAETYSEEDSNLNSVIIHVLTPGREHDNSESAADSKTIFRDVIRIRNWPGSAALRSGRRGLIWR